MPDMRAMHGLGASLSSSLACLCYPYAGNYLVLTSDAPRSLQTQCDILATVWHIYHTYHINPIMISIDTISTAHPLPHTGIILMYNTNLIWYNLETPCIYTQHCDHVITIMRVDTPLFQCRHTHCLTRSGNKAWTPVFHLCSTFVLSILEQTKNKPGTGTKGEHWWPPTGLRVVICYVPPFWGDIIKFTNIHHWHAK